MAKKDLVFLAHENQTVHDKMLTLTQSNNNVSQLTIVKVK